MPKRAASPKKGASKKAKPAKDPNAPKRPLSAYFIFLNDFRAKTKKENPDLVKNVKEFGKAAGEEWRSLSDSDKEPYMEKNAELKEEYEEAMKHYKPPKGFSKSGKGSKKAKDPNAPKKPMTAFFLFMGENRQRVKEEDPDLSHTQVAKQLGEEWQNLDADEKADFEGRYQTALAKWKKEKAAYDKKQSAAPKKAAPPSSDEDESESESESE